MKLMIFVLAIAAAGAAGPARGPGANPPATNAMNSTLPADSIQLNAVNVWHNIDYGREGTEELGVSVRVTWTSPRWIAYVLDPSIPLKALDSRGNSLLLPAAVQENALRSPAASHARDEIQARILLRRPRNVVQLGERVELVEGSFKAAVVSRIDRVELDPLQRETRQYGNVSAVFESVASGNRFHLKATFTRRDMSDAEWQESDRRLQSIRIHLLDAQGVAWFTSGASVANSPDPQRERSIGYGFGQRTGSGEMAGTAAKVIFEVPAEIQWVSIPYSFKNLPLP